MLCNVCLLTCVNKATSLLYLNSVCQAVLYLPPMNKYNDSAFWISSFVDELSGKLLKCVIAKKLI